MAVEAPLEVGFVVALLFFGSIIIFTQLNEAGLSKELVANKEVLAKITLDFLENSGINDKIRLYYITNKSDFLTEAQSMINDYLSKVSYCYKIYTDDRSIDVNTCSGERTCGRASGYLIANRTIYVEVC